METLFREAFGNTPKVKVIELLIEGRDFDYSLTDIAEGAEISRTTLFRIWKDLVNSNIVIYTRNIGNAKMYKINRNNPFVEMLIKSYDEIILKSVEEKIKKPLQLSSTQP